MVMTDSDLMKLGFRDILALFSRLEAPTLTEMHGEFAAKLLAQPNAASALIGHITVNNPVMPGRWLCKSFRPVDAMRGRGYNTFSQFGRTVCRYPMQTLMAPARCDGRAAYQLVYRAYKSMCGDIHMVDEVRRVGSGLYLGIGTWGFSDRQRQIPLPFMLKGPVAPYRADIGSPRNNFDIKTEVPALRHKAST